MGDESRNGMNYELIDSSLEVKDTLHISVWVQ